MFTLQFSTAFERDVKHFVRKGGDRARLNDILDLLQQGSPLPAGLRDHQLHGKMNPARELHVAHDWLLVYEKDGKELIISCLWLVTHKKLRERERDL